MFKERRRFLLNGAGVFVVATAPVSAGLLTPRQSAGPFYPTELPLDDDNDLVHVAGQDQPAQGSTADLSGRLLDSNGRPLAGMRIEIWQCDVNGRYRHPRENGKRPIDPGFQGFGHAISDAQGRYRFLTIRPVSYPGRAPHIHVAVYPPGERPFVTQLYVADEERNDSDFLYRRIPTESGHLVTAAFEPANDGQAELKAHWDILLGVT